MLNVLGILKVLLVQLLAFRVLFSLEVSVEVDSMRNKGWAFLQSKFSFFLFHSISCPLLWASTLGFWRVLFIPLPSPTDRISPKITQVCWSRGSWLLNKKLFLVLSKQIKKNQSVSNLSCYWELSKMAFITWKFYHCIMDSLWKSLPPTQQ